MLPSLPFLKRQLEGILRNKFEQGHQTSGYLAKLEQLPASYDAYVEFAHSMAELPMRDNWSYFEPNDLEGIWRECDSDRPLGQIGILNLQDSSKRVEAGFLASVCGSMLGKPIEVNPSLKELREALTSVGEWPLNDYISDEILHALDRRHWSWYETTRGRIQYVVPDDDINYTLMGMMTLEQFGTGFTKRNVRDLWINHLPISTTWGPERAILLRSGISYLEHDRDEFNHAEIEAWPDFMVQDTELCGAAIRADAYGYACPGQPSLAAELAWRDASFTHRQTGIYATMFIAAMISVAQVLRDPIEIMNTALQFVPRRSRFYEITKDCLQMVANADDWLEAYQIINHKYAKYSHCQVYQEIGTLMNTFRFADNVGDGICKQVMQGNDTDSFGATVGSLLGVYFGFDGLDARWLTPFHNRIHTGLANFHEQKLSVLAERMGCLPQMLHRGRHRIQPSELYVNV
ncbi:ADP-ribosylglycohydrolase family protein [Paenibacillus sp. KS-LC4]|uniref:ADP-ribosylglycohydrolase family protein n=1 Tax=Paenibacillus sp. KS-LC4 TaxID=2979727 RepID=UPI0030D3C235